MADDNKVKEAKQKKRKIIYKNQAVQNDKEEKWAKRIVKWFIIAGTAIIIAVVAFLVFMIATGGPGDGEEVTVEVPSGSTTTEIASILDDQDVIFSGPIFSAYMRLVDAPGIQAGIYNLSTSSGYEETINLLADGPSASSDVTLVVPEGEDIVTISATIAEVTGQTEEEVMAVIEDDEFFNDMLAQYPDLLGAVAENDDVRYKLEGYLYPATYEIHKDQSIEDILATMITTADDIRSQHAAEIEASELNYHEILTLASLIEAEASTPEDRRTIAGVFYNRLEIDMPLQSDISILYANETHSAYVTIEDTEVDSPYNLYMNTGFGPGPFNNPGADAIDAALNPEDNDYFYFVADLRTGEVYYSETFEEHNALVEEYVTEENADL